MSQMNRLWAPWRKAYIRPESKKSKGCLFCRLYTEKKDSQNYILKRSRFSYAILNLYPYNNGHTMIVPARHVDSVHALTDKEKLDWLALYDETLAAIKKAMRPHAFNAGINIGRYAGAGVPHHLHLHIVPRWKGDSNFMPVVDGTRIISESLSSAYECISKAFSRLKKSKK